MSCELWAVFKRYKNPTGGSQNIGNWAGPTNGRADACRLPSLCGRAGESPNLLRTPQKGIPQKGNPSRSIPVYLIRRATTICPMGVEILFHCPTAACRPNAAAAAGPPLPPPRLATWGGGQVKSRFTLLGGKKAMCRGGGSRAQGLVRAGVVPTTPRSLERVRRDEPSFGCVVQTRQFLFVFSLRCVGFSRSSVLKFPFKGSW